MCTVSYRYRFQNSTGNISYKLLQNFLNQYTWRFLQIELYLGLQEYLKIFRMKICTRSADIFVEVFSKIGPWLNSTSLHISTLNHDLMNYNLVTIIHYRLCCEFYHVSGLSVTVRNPHNRWQHTAQLRANIINIPTPSLSDYLTRLTTVTVNALTLTEFWTKPTLIPTV
jgi:hypothetical protein